MKYKLDILEKNNIEYDWKTVYVGLKLNFIDGEEVQNYAVSIIENAESINENIMKLAWGIEEERLEESIRNILEDAGIEDSSKELELEERKWRYCILKQISNTYSCRDIINKINDVFAHFGYPVDMVGFINYMPPSDVYNPAEYTYNENFDRLISNFNNFLKEEESLIKIS
ncbi:MAG TPA: DUF2247 domain-containing protein [Clostridium sp.]|nr:DUF2247 domain-containing protein [Clostridium sp.]